MPRTDECFELCLTEDEYAYLRYLMATREASNINEAQRRHLWDKLNYANDLAHNPNMMQARNIVAEYRTLRRRYGAYEAFTGEKHQIEMVIARSVLADPHSREYIEEHIPEGAVNWHILNEDIDFNQLIMPAFSSGSIDIQAEVNLKDLYRQYIHNEDFELRFNVDDIFKDNEDNKKTLGFFEE